MTRLIKVYGERNTNTNYVSRLIELNLDAREISGVVPALVGGLQSVLPGKEWLRDLHFACTFRYNLGWKHARVKPWSQLEKYPLARADLAFLTLTKNPYSWLLSLHRRPYHQYYRGQKPDFETFLQQPWRTVRRDNAAPILDSPIALWNIKNRSYLQLDPKRTLHLTTEAVIENPEEIIARISSRLGIARKAGPFVNYDASTKDDGKDSHYYRDHYLNEKWRSQLSAAAIAIINRTVERDLMSYFGYRVIEG